MRHFDAYLAGVSVDGLVSGSCQLEAAVRFDLTFAEVETGILELGLCPARYKHNRQTISSAEQLALHRSTFVVIGCGGLGGHVIEELARLGVGRINVVDPEFIEGHNLNRQSLAAIGGQGGVNLKFAASRVCEINPAITVVFHRTALSSQNSRELLAGATVVVRALDNMAICIELAEICRELGVSLVDGVEGFVGLRGSTSLGSLLNQTVQVKNPHLQTVCSSTSD